VRRLAHALSDLPHPDRLARALFYGSGELAGRAATLGDLETDVSTFVITYLAGARTLTPSEGEPS